MRTRFLAAFVVALLAATASAVAAPSPSDLEAELVCPTCKTTLDQSDAPIARRMKQIIRTRLSEGASEKQIKSELVAQFGPGGGALGVGAIAWGWSRRRRDEAPVDPLDPELERRLDAELDRYET